MSDLFLRKVGLVVANQSGQGLDLSNFRIVFKVSAADVESPNTASIKIYNLGRDEALQIQKEFTQVSLQAGYQQGNFGVIFQGDIKQTKIGRENAKDSYVQIFAADGDAAYNFGTVNTTLAAGATQQQQAQAVAQQLQQHGVGAADYTGLQQSTVGTGGILPRGKVMFGLGRSYLRDVADTSNTSWSIQNGVLTFTSDTGYLPGEAVALNSDTGLIGVPEATENGIYVRSLLNPLYKIGGRVQINNDLINQTRILQQGFPQYKAVNFTADVTADGIYRILVHEMDGDSRGNDWYSNLVCLSLDGSASVNSSVKAFG